MNGLVERAALLDQLEEGSAGPVTVVAAAAGSGKTVLVRSWLERRGPAQRAAWVSVERSERDAQRFWGAVIEQLRAAGPTGETIEALTPTPDFDGHAVVQRLVSQLASLSGPLVLVIDDMHELVTAEALNQITYLLDHLPRSTHVVFITRHDLPLGLHRRRLDGQLTEIRSGHLQFTLDETRQMLAASGVALSDEGVQRLHDRTEGWAAGLRLAALALTTCPDPEKFIVEFSGSERTVAEYLVAEVLDSQPPDVRRLLTRTSLLERVNGPLADLLTGSSGNERHLQALTDAGGFVVALDVNRTWFRFHHLFSDLLAVQLRHTEPQEIPRLHLLAAKWFAEHDHIIEAITHAHAAGDSEQAAGLLIDHYYSLILDGRRGSAHSLLESFATESAALTPEIAAVVAIDQLGSGSLDQATAHVALAERQADSVPEVRRHRFDMALLVARLTLAQRLGDYRSVADAVPNASRLVDVHSGHDIAMHNDVRALLLINLANVEVWSGRFTEAAGHLTDASELALRIGRPYLHVSCLAIQAGAISMSSFSRAREACQEAVAAADSHGWGTDPVIAPALVTWGTALMQAGRLDEAEQRLTQADQAARVDLDPALGFMLHLGYGGLHMARGRSDEAITHLRRAEQIQVKLVADSPLRLQLRCSILHARLDLGELAAVADELAAQTESDQATGELREVRARLALALADPTTALDILAPTLGGRAEVHHPVVMVRSLLIEALSREALGEPLAVQDAVERALELAEPDMLILPFLHIPTGELLERHPRHRTSHGGFIAEIGDVVSGRTLAPERRPSTPLPEALSDAELRVLRFLPTNLSAGHIAGETQVSVNTVKTHMRHIYAKLGAHRRNEAVKLARELGLLGNSGRHQ